MSNHELDVTLIWAQNLMRHAAFLSQRMAGIDFGVKRDLAGLSEDEVLDAVRESGQSAQVAAQFRRLLFAMPIGSIIVTGSATGVPRRDRRWSMGRVVGGYQYRASNRYDRHIIEVEWSDGAHSEGEIADLIGVNPGGRRSTVTPLGTVDAAAFSAEASEDQPEG